jgi:hypothetical protein
MPMDEHIPPTITSFVIRFVVEPGSDTYRGEIRHVQTCEEIHFTAWQDAEKFIRRYVPIQVASGK